MAENVFRKNFVGFKGLDNRSNDLVRGKDYAISMQNFEIAYDGSVRLRRGERIVCDDGENHQAINGLMRHVRLNPTTGATEERLFGASGKDYLLREVRTNGWVSIIYTGYGEGQFSFYAVNGTFYAKGVMLSPNPVTLFNINCGEGSVGDPFITLEQLRTAINNTADFHMVISPRGICNANATCGKTTAAPLVMKAASGSVDAHNIVVGDTIKIGSVYRKITRVSGNNLWWTEDADVAVTADQVVGISHYSAACLPITVSQDCKSAALVLPISYWGDIKHPTGIAPFRDLYAESSEAIPFTEVNMGNNTFIFGDYYSTEKGRIWKFDGNEAYGAGVHPPSMVSVATPAGAGGALTASSVYKYTATASFKDYSGKIIESDPHIVGESGIDLLSTPSATKLALDVTIDLSKLAYTAGGNSNRAKIIATQTNLTTGIAVETGHTMKPGNRAFIVNVRSGVPVLEERVLTQVDDTNLYWDTAAAIDVDHTLTPHNIITNGLKWVLYRSKANGQSYYQVWEFPLDPYATAGRVTFNDGLADVGLGEQYFRPEAGREHQPPPAMQIGCEHQGLLLGASVPGGSTEYTAEPNSVYFSLPEDCEYFPRAYNTFDIPSGVVGPIAAMSSNGPSSLMVAKANARYSVLGDLDSYGFTLQKSAEYIEGCPAHDAQQLLWSAIVFPSKQGILSVVNGAADNSIGLPILKDFTKNNETYFKVGTLGAGYDSKLWFKGAKTCVDSVNQQVWFFIPCVQVDENNRFNPNSNSRLFILDLKSKAWYNWTMGLASLYPACGIRQYGGDLYWFGKGGNESSDNYGPGLITRNNSNTDYDFASSARAIEGDLRMQWEDLEDPSFNKDFLRIKIIRIDDTLANFQFDVETYLNYKVPSLYQSPNTKASLSFTYANPMELDLKLAHSKCRAIMLRLRNFANSAYVINKPMNISGYEWTVTVPYRKEDAAV